MDRKYFRPFSQANLPNPKRLNERSTRTSLIKRIQARWNLDLQWTSRPPSLINMLIYKLMKLPGKARAALNVQLGAKHILTREHDCVKPSPGLCKAYNISKQYLHAISYRSNCSSSLESKYWLPLLFLIKLLFLMEACLLGALAETMNAISPNPKHARSVLIGYIASQTNQWPVG